jgi:hypothetical protein
MNRAQAIMANLQPDTAKTSASPQRWPFLFFGILLCLLGPIIYGVRFGQYHLETPWYVPALTTVGVLFMVVSVWQRRGVLRSVVLVLFILVCCFEWFFVVVVAKTPLYTGPALPGHKMPTFATTLADGKTFTNKDLEAGTSTVLIFYRGRW